MNLRNRIAKWSLPGRAKKFIAVDFDSRQLRIVQARQGGQQTRVLKLTQVDMPPEMDTADPRAVGAFLGKTLRKLHLTGTGVLMNVPRAQALLKPLTLPPGTEETEIANMLRFQVEKELPYDVSEAVVDYTMTSHFDVAANGESAADGVSVLAAVVKVPVVEHYMQIAAAANVRLLRLGLRPYAILRCADSCILRGEDEALAVVFLTADETEINVLVGSSLTFTRSAMVPIRPPGAGSDPAVKETVELLVNEITRSLQSYQTVHGGRKIDAALLAGGTGVESRVAMELAQRMKVKCHTFDPSGALGLRESAPDTSAFMAAIGLAIGHRGAEPPFDFLAPKKPKIKRDLRRVRVLGGVMIAALVLVSGYLAVDNHLQAKEQRLTLLRRQYANEKAVSKQVRALGRYVKAVEDWEDGDRDWLGHWAKISALMPSCEYVYIDKFKTNRSDGSVGFILRATDDGYVDQFAAALTKAGYEFTRGRSATVEADKEEYRSRTDMRILIPKEMHLQLASLEPKPRPPDDDSLTRFRPGTRLPPNGIPNTPPPSRPTSARPPSPPASPSGRPSGPWRPGGSSPRPGGASGKPSGPSGKPASPAASGKYLQINVAQERAPLRRPTGPMSPELARARAEWERRMDPYWRKEIERRIRSVNGKVTEEMFRKWQEEFAERSEKYWVKEAERRSRGNGSNKNGGSSKKYGRDRGRSR